MRCGAGCRGRLIRGCFELGRRLARPFRRGLRLRQLEAKLLPQHGCGLASHRDPLAGRTEPVERCRRTLASTGGIRELVLDPPALRPQGIEPLLGTRGGESLQRGEPLLRSAGALRTGAARSGCGTGGGRCLRDVSLELERGVIGPLHRGRFGLGEIRAEPHEQPLRAFLAERDSLARRLEPVERLDRRLPAPGGVGELLLGGVPLREERL